MLDKLKELWNRWNVQVKVVGGALVVATVWGTCVYEPALPAAEDDATEQEAEPTSTTTTEGTTTTTTEDTTATE